MIHRFNLQTINKYNNKFNFINFQSNLLSVSFASFLCDHSDFSLFCVGDCGLTTEFTFPIELALYNSSFPSCNGASHCRDARVWHNQAKRVLFLQHPC